MAQGVLWHHYKWTSHSYFFFVFLTILGVYGLHRLYKFKQNKLIGERRSWVKKNFTLLFVTTTLSLIAATIILYFFASDFLFSAKDTDIKLSFGLILLFCILVSAWYVIPFFKKSLRQIPFLKASTVALVWTCILIGLPAHASTGKVPVLLLLHYFIFFYALTIPFNIRDVVEDEKEAKTLVHFLGKRTSILLSVILLLFFHLGNLFSDYTLLSSPCYWIFTLESVVVLTLAKSTRSFYYFALVDAQMLILGVVLLTVV